MNLLRDTLAARADRSDHLDVHGMLAAVHDLADRRAARRKTAYAATGASVGVAALVAGSVALASNSGTGGGSGRHAEQSGGGPVVPLPAPRSGTLVPLPPASIAPGDCSSAVPATASGAPVSLPPVESCPPTTVPVNSVPSSALVPAYTSSLSIFSDAPPAPSDAPVSLGLLPTGWRYDRTTVVHGQRASEYGPTGQSPAFAVWAIPAGSYGTASANASSTAPHGSYDEPRPLRAGDAPAHILRDGAMVVLEVLRPTTLTDQDAQTILGSATNR